MVTALTAAGAAISLARNTVFNRTAVCALVLEDNPVGEDSRLEFETFPGEIEESYAVSQYEEIAGTRMSQPASAAYRGGNWGQFTLQIEFHAGLKYTPLISDLDPRGLDPTDIERLLIENERKARWCQALTFPLARSFGPSFKRILPSPPTGGVTFSAETLKALDNLKRKDPPIVLVVFGSWHIIRGYVLTSTLKWVGPWHPTTARPYGAMVTLSIQPIMPEYPTWETIRNLSTKGGFTTNTPEIHGVVGPKDATANAAREARAVVAVRARENADAAATLVNLGGAFPIPGL
jgi:hypothetical protein